MFHLPSKGFARGDTVRMRGTHGSVRHGAIGTVMEVFWSSERCLVEFLDDTHLLLRWHQLEAVTEPLRESELNGQ
jgi:hypothetical protein